MIGLSINNSYTNKLNTKLITIEMDLFVLSINLIIHVKSI